VTRASAWGKWAVVVTLIALVWCTEHWRPVPASPASGSQAGVVCHIDNNLIGCAEPWAITAFGLFQGGQVHASARRTGEQDLALTIVTRTVDASIQCTIRIHGEATGPTASAEIAESYSGSGADRAAYSGDIQLSCFPFPKGAELNCTVALMRPGSAPLELYEACVQATVE
jgi:hypothetical protein